MTEKSNGIERRKFGRKETNLDATARLASGLIAKCVIRDLSQGGALVEFPDGAVQPGRLRLSWEGNADVLCEVRRVAGNRAGVEFTNSAHLNIARPMVEPGLAANLPAGYVPVESVPADTHAGQRLVASLRGAMQARATASR
jgi:hypothetical protein